MRDLDLSVLSFLKALGSWVERLVPVILVLSKLRQFTARGSL